jgi:hypothetical protein
MTAKLFPIWERIKIMDFINDHESRRDLYTTGRKYSCENKHWCFQSFLFSFSHSTIKSHKLPGMRNGMIGSSAGVQKSRESCILWGTGFRSINTVSQPLQ